MQAFYRNKSSKISSIIFLLCSFVQIISNLQRKNYIFLWLWAVLAAAFIALLILITVQPYVILTANTIKIRQTPFSLREYRLDRLQFHKKGTEFIIFHYLGEGDAEKVVKLDHLILDPEDLATIMSFIKKASGATDSGPTPEKMD
ncbi:MAG: hypothetical protein GX890_01305 [Firmicutes bacterium]|nr:hypothetical protein [Bacillota bacterium]HPU00337.1 hypothetical protein [Bacillota bacterium]